jgi:hypothetical protein
VILRLGGDHKVAWRAYCKCVFYSFPRHFTVNFLHHLPHKIGKKKTWVYDL